MLIRIYHEDTDAQGIVYHANYLNYMDRARNEWLLSIGFDAEKMQQENAIFVVHSSEQSFKAPAKLYDNIRVNTRIVKAGKAYLLFEQVVFAVGDDNRILCSANTKLACVNKNLKPRLLPKIVANAVINLPTNYSPSKTS